MECIFCKIANGETGELIYQDDQIVAFDDITPQAPHHVLVVPKKHIATINDITKNDESLLGHMLFTAKEIAKKRSLAENGYRLVFNCNHQGGQAVYHIHLHLLAGRQMHWPPG